MRLLGNRRPIVLALASATLTLTSGSPQGAPVSTTSKPITIFLGGDVLPGRGVTPRWNAEQTSLHFFAPLSQRADLAFCNLEAAPFEASHRRRPSFEPGQLEGLQDAGYDVVSLANNHALDGGEPGVRATLQCLRALGLEGVGGSFENSTVAELRLFSPLSLGLPGSNPLWASPISRACGSGCPCWTAFNPLWASPISPFAKGRGDYPFEERRYGFNPVRDIRSSPPLEVPTYAGSPLYEGGDGRSPEGVKPRASEQTANRTEETRVSDDWRQIERGGVTFLATTQYGPHEAGHAHLAAPDAAFVARVRAAAAHSVVVVSLHWGVEGQTAPTAWQRAFAHRLIEAGARVVVGHHPHVAGPVESYKGRPIFYSLGNFVWDTMPPRAMPQPQSGLVAQVRLAPDGTATWKTWAVVPTDAGSPLPPGETRLGSVSGLFAQRQWPERVVWSRDARGHNRLRDWQWRGSKWAVVAQSIAGDLTRLVAGDVDGDGRDELLVEVRQRAKLELQVLPRLQVYAVNERGGFVPRWRGSHLSRPFLGWTTWPAPDGRSVGILAREVNRAPQWRGYEWLALYRWNDFGFRLTWEISVHGRIGGLRSGRDAGGPWATFTQVEGKKAKKWRLRPAVREDGAEKLRAELVSAL